MASAHMYSNVGYRIDQTGASETQMMSNVGYRLDQTGASEARVMSNVGMVSPFGDPRTTVSFGWGQALVPAITVLAPETTGRGSTHMYTNVEEAT